MSCYKERDTVSSQCYTWKRNFYITDIRIPNGNPQKGEADRLSSLWTQTISAYYVPCPFEIHGMLGKVGESVEGK